MSRRGTLIVVSALPLGDDEDAEALATKVADAMAEAAGSREGEGVQSWAETKLAPRAATFRAIASARTPE